MRVSIGIGQYFSPKLKLFSAGRKDIFHKLEAAFATNSQPIIWIHCASLGEFEQGRPVIEQFKMEYPRHKILLTFFSPSGFEVRKDYEFADYVFYLPLDTPANARKFIAITKPILAIFVKYEFWRNYCLALHQQQVPILSISSIFREDQLFFKSYGGVYRDMLKLFSHFFVQNEVSIKLLDSIGIEQTTLVGDTRFDRVFQIVSQGKDIPIANRFKDSQKIFVIGSCWAEDMDVLVPFINEHYYQLKFIIAPHEIDEETLREVEGALEVKSIRYSRAEAVDDLGDHQVLLIDNMGMLSSLYKYGEFAYIGGAFGKGLHNILEAACYGIPVFFGNRNYQKYEEANELIMRGGAFEVDDYPDLKAKYEMINVPENFLLACEVTKLYVQENLGATEKIMAYCRQLLNA